jgi:tight adherence protein C
MPLTVVLLIVVLVVACAVAVYSFSANRERRMTLARASAAGAGNVPVQIDILRDDAPGLAGRLASWLREHSPKSWSDAGSATEVLVHAGFDGPEAPLFYTSIRLAAAVFLPLLAFTFGPHERALHLAMLVGLAIIAGVIGPRAILDRLAQRRQTRIRKSIPDSLDLLVVCVEAGTGLDSAMLRVARDMAALHPELAGELFVVNRRMNAGLGRAEALQGLARRTGVEELRGLASSMIQSERLGSSIARVLRVYSETLRRERKQAAEKRAAQATVKMIFPLALFMLPSLFAMLLGPAFFMMKDTLGKLNQ